MTHTLTAGQDTRVLLSDAARNLVGFGLLLAAGALGLQAVLDLSWLYVCKVAAVYIAGSGLVLAGLKPHHPFDRLGPANQVTLFRGLLVAWVAGFIGEEPTTMQAIVVIGTGLLSLILDGFDGRLARRSRMSSTFGARFDMETDALLVLLFATMAWQFGKAGSWVLLSGLLRYFFVAAGWALPWMQRALPPSRRRQTVCVVQISVMLAVMLPVLPFPYSAALAGIALAILTGSFAVDVLWLFRMRSIS